MENEAHHQAGPDLENPTEQIKRQVRETANFQGNDSMLLFERLRHPRIRRQIIDLYMQAAAPYYEKIKKEPLSRQWFEDLTENGLKSAEIFTSISLDPKDTRGPSVNRINLHYRHPDNNKVTAKQWSIYEAHEKGHEVRFYNDDNLADFFVGHFLKGLDLSAVEFTEADYQAWLKLDPKKESFDKAKKGFMKYLFSPIEIAERLSQLKNYFGMNGDGIFTKEHLDYARKHYVNDIGFDNGMSHLLQAVTPEKEAAFLETINNSGI